MASPPRDEAARRAIAAFNAAADTYDHPALGFWSRAGRGTVDRVGLRRGEHVLDVPAGSGASALPAAEAVGPDGRVVAVDIAPTLLELVRGKATAQGVANLELRVADMRSLDDPDESFDAVTCVFGVFFVPDREELVRSLWRLVKPGGRLAITTWGPDVLEPGSSAFWSSVEAVRPDLVRGFNPWDDLVEPAQVRSLFEGAGISGSSADLEPADQPLEGPEDWWAIVLGTGFRGTVDLLTADEREQVRRATLESMRDVRSVRASAIYGLAAKP